MFDALSWLQLEIIMLGELILGVLWYAPAAAAMLLLSAWVRRPVLWAILPTIFAPGLERIALAPTRVEFLDYRTVGIWAILSHDLNINPESMQSQTLSSALMQQLHFGAAFTNADLGPAWGRGPGLRHHPHPPLPRRDLAAAARRICCASPREPST